MLIRFHVDNITGRWALISRVASSLDPMPLKLSDLPHKLFLYMSVKMDSRSLEIRETARLRAALRPFRR